MAYVMGKSVRNNSIEKDIRKPESLTLNLNFQKENNTSSQNNLISTAQRITAPFGSSSIKDILNPSEPSNAPGPGSYLQSLKNINTIPNSNKFFITGDTRFKSSDNHIPGVGQYNINLYNNQSSTPKKINSNFFKKFNLYDFILNEKLQTLPNKLPMYNINNINNKNNISTKDNQKTNNKNIFNLKKHNNAIDWKKVSKKNLELESNNNSLLNLDNKNTTNDFVMLTEFNIIGNKNENNTSLNKEKEKEKINNNEQKNIIYKNSILGFKDNFDSSLINLTSTPIQNKQNKENVEPGPGTYEPKNLNFKLEPKKNKYQNFGTYESRNMFPISLNKNKNMNNLRLNTDTSLNNLRFKNKLNENRNKLNKYKRLLHNLRFNIIKEQAKQYKKNVEDNLGPGSYSPNNFYNLKKNHQMTKTININEKKVPSYLDRNDNPGVGEYDVKGEYKQNIEKNLTLQKSKMDKEKYDKKIFIENIIKKNKIKQLQQQRRFIKIDYTETDEYKIRKQYMHNSFFRPPFNSAEPKFKLENKNDTNINIYQNEYTDYPSKKINRLNIPFLSKAIRKCNQTIDANSVKKVGPGSYEQKSFFDWNKKSFNVQYKLK